MKNNNGWHIDKRISVGHMVTTLSVAIGAAMYIGTVDSKTELNRARIEQVEKRQDRTDARVDQRLERIEKKLDRLLERE